VSRILKVFPIEFMILPKRAAKQASYNKKFIFGFFGELESFFFCPSIDVRLTVIRGAFAKTLLPCASAA
jgi:hypothetical protein